MLCGRHPYAGAKNFFELSQLIRNHDVNFELIPGKARATIEKMMKADPSERASVTDLLKDEWITADGKD